MRRRAHLDANHEAIVEALIGRGARVLSLAAEGNGCPDLLIGWRGANYLLEVKREGYDKKAGKLRQKTREMQIMWALKWTGQYTIVTSPQEALDFLEMQK